MGWPLDFISEEDFVRHVGATIEKYGEKLESYDVKRFNKNIIDPIKLIFDKTVYQTSWEGMAMAMAVYMLGFNSYLGFADSIENGSNGMEEENYLKRIYAYAKGKPFCGTTTIVN